ncbi:MAG: xanthine dehydrogenase, partial [Desulfobacteraceae bacterium]
MKNIEIDKHVRGESEYIDDIPVREGTLYAAVYASPTAHGILKSLRLDTALQSEGVVDVLTDRHIPGVNQIGIAVADEPLLAEDRVYYRGQPIALVLADSEKNARAAVKKIIVETEALPAITDAREAFQQGRFVVPPRTFQAGELETAWKQCRHVFEGRVETGGQEHLYLETQSAYAYGTATGGIRILSSSQSPTVVQKTAAAVLGVPMHRIEVDVPRIGGGFGGKESQATVWAVLAALGAFRLQRPVKLVLHRLEDLAMTGKRHPYHSDFKIGLDRDLKILAYEVRFFQNAGAFADLSPAVMERTLFHAANSYFIPHVKATAYSCRTHLPPNTAMRGFGAPQGMFVIESAIARAAEKLGIDAAVIQKKNLLKEGDAFHYGQKAARCLAEKCWNKAGVLYQVASLRKEIKKFNRSNKLFKKGLAIMPLCFGISFTKTFMNQAGALVHIYQDGSVGINTGAVEMGQGVNTKMIQVAARVFSIAPDQIRIESTNTTRVANTSPTAASAGADLNGKAVEKACGALLKRLLEFASREIGVVSKEEIRGIRIENGTVYNAKGKTGLDWKSLVQRAYLQRIDLSEHDFYATPLIHFNPETNKGQPFAYHVYGTAAITATVDCLRGVYEIDSVRVVHDSGQSMNPLIDQGQAEGGIVQGIGWMTMEELRYSHDGRLESNSLSTYKIPDIYAAPETLAIHFLETQGPAPAILRSKAIGEPPFMYGIGAYFAIRNAVRAARGGRSFAFSAPLTPEKVLLALYQ